jgi:hypothetical protein
MSSTKKQKISKCVMEQLRGNDSEISLVRQESSSSISCSSNSTSHSVNISISKETAVVEEKPTLVIEKNGAKVSIYL